MVRAVHNFLTSGIGFLLVSVLAAYGVVICVDAGGIEQATGFARWAWAPSALVVGLHLTVVRQLYELRDVDELRADERATLRAILHRRTSAIWGWIVVVVALGALGAGTPMLIPFAGVWIVYLAWIGLSWALYSLLLIPLWSSEIASFRSLIADRKRERDARDAALKAITSDAEKGWSQVEELKAYIRPPE